MTNFLLLLAVSGMFFWSNQFFLIDGQSMKPNLSSGQIVMMSTKFSADDLERGKIVVFLSEDRKILVKRILGVPGDKLKLAGKSVFLRDENGQYRALKEDYLNSSNYEYGDERYFFVPERAYFVMGDNRAESRDSRYFKETYIPIERIMGVLKVD